MENAVEALKMAFAVIVLVIALSLSIKMFSQARETSDVVIRTADETTYYDYEKYKKNGNVGENRIVGLEAVIPTLYKYSKEDYRVVFKTAIGKYTDTMPNEDIKDIDEVTDPLPVYRSTTKADLWNKYYTGYNNADDGTYTESYSHKLNAKKGLDQSLISVFDVDEEKQRNEPWTGKARDSNGESEVIKNLKALIGCGRYYLPAYGDTEHYIDYSIGSSKNLFYLKKDKLTQLKFIELIGREQTVKTGNKTTTKTIITYVLIAD